VERSTKELRELLALALRRYTVAKAATANARELYADLPHPDGTDAIVRALRVENDALREYTKALHEFARALLGDE
jgi:hypothetical protein